MGHNVAALFVALCAVLGIGRKCASIGLWSQSSDVRLLLWRVRLLGVRRRMVRRRLYSFYMYGGGRVRSWNGP